MNCCSLFLANEVGVVRVGTEVRVGMEVRVGTEVREVREVRVVGERPISFLFGRRNVRPIRLVIRLATD
jgi:hypothetical protein